MKERIDTTATVLLFTPGGMIVGIPSDQLTDAVVVEYLERNEDAKAATEMARLTGLDVTVRRETQTTVRAADLIETYGENL